MIPQRNISLISNTLMSASGRRIPEVVIERDYVLAWFVTGLAGHPRGSPQPPEQPHVLSALPGAAARCE